MIARSTSHFNKSWHDHNNCLTSFPSHTKLDKELVYTVKFAFLNYAQVRNHCIIQIMTNFLHVYLKYNQVFCSTYTSYFIIKL